MITTLLDHVTVQRGIPKKVLPTLSSIDAFDQRVEEEFSDAEIYDEVVFTSEAIY